MRARLNWRIIFAIFTIHALLNFTYKYLDFAARAHPIPVLFPAIEEVTGHYTAFFLFPLVVLFIRRFPLRWRTASLYLTLLVVFSFAHTSLNWVTRSALFPVFGLGPYDYGIMRVRYFMEFPGDVFLLTLMIGTVAIADFFMAAKQRQIETAHLEQSLAQTQLQNLRLQLHPHFLFNALNTISAVMYEDPGAADEMISRLSQFLRLTLSNSPAQEVRLSEELRFLELYLDIMRSRFEDKLQVRLDIEQGTHDALVPQLILQPLVENSIRHGAELLTGRVGIDVTARRAAGALEITVRDRGPGLMKEHKPGERGIGLENTAGRLDRLYGGGRRLSFANPVDGGLQVSVSIPFHT